MNWITKIFTKRDWRLCGTMVAPYMVTNRVTKSTIKDGCEYTYYLYENQFGERKFDVLDSETGDIDIKKALRSDYVFRNETYRTQVRPWLDGRRVPGIPSYEQVPVEEFADLLKGKK